VKADHLSYFLGFDGGGSKTDCVLVDEHGVLLASAYGSASNPLRTGYAKTWFALSSTADAVLARQKIKSTDIAGICAGLGGAARTQVARRIASFLERSFPNAAVQVTSDMDIALAAAVGEGRGIVLIAGTGSVAFGRTGEGVTARAGGFGPWIGDEGSGFEIGKLAAAAASRDVDARGAQTMLSERIFKDLDCRDWNELFERIAKSADDVFPRLFPTVAQVAHAGDPVACEILQHAAASLSDLAYNVAKKLQLAGEEFPLAKVGGMHGRSKLLDAELDARLAAVLPRAIMVPLAIPPALAAARMASSAASGHSPVAKAADVT
jgi:N-acetylglucosamine kinase-like BadF-type ATPase